MAPPVDTVMQRALAQARALYPATPSAPPATAPAPATQPAPAPATQPAAPSPASLNRIADDCARLRATPATAPTTQPSTQPAQTPYSLTLYVDEESIDKATQGCLNGHVFVRLANGQDKQTVGFYSHDKSLALAGRGGGEIRDDAKSPWTVRKSYPLTAEQYQKAQQAMTDWQKQGEAWSPNHHCGDFAETVAKAAGVDLDLKPTLFGRNRPNLFGDYLRQHGGSDDPKATLPGD